MKFKTPEIISISEGLIVEPPSPDDQPNGVEEEVDQLKNTQNTRDLELAYDELASLRVECERLRSLVSQLPGIELRPFSMSDDHTHEDSLGDLTIKPIYRDALHDHSGFATQGGVSRTNGSIGAEHPSHKEREFIMKLDRLVWRKSRDVNEVLSPSNLDNLFERMSLWERAVRTRYRQRPF